MGDGTDKGMNTGIGFVTGNMSYIDTDPELWYDLLDKLFDKKNYQSLTTFLMNIISIKEKEKEAKLERDPLDMSSPKKGKGAFDKIELSRLKQFLNQLRKWKVENEGYHNKEMIVAMAGKANVSVDKIRQVGITGIN